MYDCAVSSGHYFDLNDLMAECSTITSHFDVTVLNMGYLLSKKSTKQPKYEHIPTGTKLELPLWLARDLFKRKVYIKMEVPRYLKEHYRKAYLADATVLNLQKYGPFFYLLAQKFCYMIIKNDSQALDILECIEMTWNQRIKTIINQAQNNNKNRINTICQGLDNTEKVIFNILFDEYQKYEHWKDGKLRKYAILPVINRPAEITHSIDKYTIEPFYQLSSMVQKTNSVSKQMLNDFELLISKFYININEVKNDPNLVIQLSQLDSFVTLTNHIKHLFYHKTKNNNRSDPCNHSAAKLINILTENKINDFFCYSDNRQLLDRFVTKWIVYSLLSDGMTTNFNNLIIYQQQIKKIYFPQAHVRNVEFIVHIKTIFEANIEEFKLDLIGMYSAQELSQWSNSLADLLSGNNIRINSVSSNMILNTSDVQSSNTDTNIELLTSKALMGEKFYEKSESERSSNGSDEHKRIFLTLMFAHAHNFNGFFQIIGKSSFACKTMHESSCFSNTTKDNSEFSDESSMYSDENSTNEFHENIVERIFTKYGIVEDLFTASTNQNLLTNHENFMGFTQNEESMLTIKIYEHILKKESELFTEEQKCQIIDRLVKHRFNVLALNDNQSDELSSKNKKVNTIRSSTNDLSHEPIEKSGHLFRNTTGFCRFQLDDYQKCESCHGIVWNFKNYLMCSRCHISLHKNCLSYYAKECVYKVYNLGKPFQANLIEYKPNNDLNSQKYRCFTCNRLLKGRIDYFGSSHKGADYFFCHYTGFYYCKYCHFNDTYFIPSKLINRADTNYYPMCRDAYLLLRAISNNVNCTFNLPEVVPDIINLIPTHLVFLKQYQTLTHMVEYITVCRYANKCGLYNQLKQYQHLMKDPPNFTLRNIVELINSTLIDKINHVIALFYKHITEDCVLCQGRGHICLVCFHSEPIFRFEKNITTCASCNNISHTSCVTNQLVCPKCKQLLPII